MYKNVFKQYRVVLLAQRRGMAALTARAQCLPGKWLDGKLSLQLWFTAIWRKYIFCFSTTRANHQMQTGLSGFSNSYPGNSIWAVTVCRHSIF